jgi:hypothetical protein
MFNIFQQPWTLLGASIIVLFGVLTFRGVVPEKRSWRQWLLPISVAAAAFGFDFLIATDVEKIQSLTSTAIKAVENEDFTAIENIIADDYADSRHATKDSLMAHCRSELSASPIEENRKLDVLVEVKAPTATATISLLIKFAKDSRIAAEYKRYLLVKARLYFAQQTDHRWLINRVELLEIDKQPVSWRGAT